MPGLTLAKPQLIEFGANPLSEHNRNPVQVGLERIEQTVRVANGSLRKFHVADKHRFSISWNLLPESAADTVDGEWGAGEIATFVANNPGTFNMRVVYDTGEDETYEVSVASFSRTIIRRWDARYWDITLTLEEV